MASVQKYIERRSDEELRGILSSYCRGIADIPMDTAFLICRALAKCHPELPNPHELFVNLCLRYC